MVVQKEIKTMPIIDIGVTPEEGEPPIISPEERERIERIWQALQSITTENETITVSELSQRLFPFREDPTLGLESLGQTNISFGRNFGTVVKIAADQGLVERELENPHRVKPTPTFETTPGQVRRLAIISGVYTGDKRTGEEIKEICQREYPQDFDIPPPEPWSPEPWDWEGTSAEELQGITQCFEKATRGIPLNEVSAQQPETPEVSSRFIGTISWMVFSLSKDKTVLQHREVSNVQFLRWLERICVYLQREGITLGELAGRVRQRQLFLDKIGPGATPSELQV